MVGLGNVGTRVLRALHERGFPVVAVDHEDHAYGAQYVREQHIAFIVGDESRESTLRRANVAHAAALLVLTSDDVVNLEYALQGQQLQPALRVVLRLFDGDFAERVNEVFKVTISRSVSYLAASSFAAAMVGREVIGTIPVRRRVLLVADIPVFAGSGLAGRTLASFDATGQVRVIALTTRPVGRRCGRRPTVRSRSVITCSSWRRGRDSRRSSSRMHRSSDRPRPMRSGRCLSARLILLLWSLRVPTAAATAQPDTVSGVDRPTSDAAPDRAVTVSARPRLATRRVAPAGWWWDALAIIAFVVLTLVLNAGHLVAFDLRVRDWCARPRGARADRRRAQLSRPGRLLHRGVRSAGRVLGLAAALGAAAAAGDRWRSC